MAATKPAFNPPGKKGDIIFSVLVKLAALIVLLMLGGIIVSLIISSWPSIQKFGLAFLWTKEWDAPNDIYGALVPIYGTLVTSFIALLIAVPVSFGIALFLTELAPGWLKRPLGIAIELLAAIPSIVYGMWGLFIFAPLFAVYFQEPVGNIMSNIPIVGALFSGPAFFSGPSCTRNSPSQTMVISLSSSSTTSAAAANAYGCCALRLTRCTSDA